MTTATTASPLVLVPSLETTWEDVDSSFERFCLTAGIGAIERLCDDAQQLAGAPDNSGVSRIGHRWGRTQGKSGASRLQPLITMMDSPHPCMYTVTGTPTRGAK